MINMNGIAKAADMAGIGDIGDNHLLLRKFLEAYNKLQENPYSDPEAWREEYRKKQDSGIRYEQYSCMGREWNRGVFEFVGKKEHCREVVETPNPPFPDLGGFVKPKEGEISYVTHAGGGGSCCVNSGSGATTNAKPPLPHLESRKLWLAQREAGTNEVWQWKHLDGAWVDLDIEPRWTEKKEYRPKPKTEKRYMAMVRYSSNETIAAHMFDSVDDVNSYIREHICTLIGDIVERGVEL